MTRSRIATASALTILVVALTSVAGCKSDGDSSDRYHRDGPGEAMLDDGVVASTFVRADAGATIAYGTPALKNTGDAPITVQEVRLVGDVPPSAAKVVEVRTRDYALGDHLGATPTWPLPRYERESEVLDHYELKPGQLVKMIVVVRVNRTGVWYWPKTQFIYESDGDTYLAEAAFGYDICPTDRDLSNSLDHREDGACLR